MSFMHIFKCKKKFCPKAFENAFISQPKKLSAKKKLYAAWILFQNWIKPGMHKSFWLKFLEYNSTWSKYCLDQYKPLKFFKGELKAYLFTHDDVTFLFWYCVTIPKGFMFINKW